MLKDVPYDLLKEDSRMYEIMLLRDQSSSAFGSIAKAVQLSARTVRNTYHKIKFVQSRLYISHISIVLGVDRSQIEAIYKQAMACYQDEQYACAYLEQKYHDILTAYRKGEPGMPKQFVESMPPFQLELPPEIVARIMEMRDVENASFVKIGKALHMTQQKAKCIYDDHYHARMLELITELEAKADCASEKWEIWEYCFKNNHSPKNCCDMLKKINAAGFLSTK